MSQEELSGVLGNGRAGMDSSAGGCLQKVLLDNVVIRYTEVVAAQIIFLPIKTVFVCDKSPKTRANIQHWRQHKNQMQMHNLLHNESSDKAGVVSRSVYRNTSNL